MIASVCLGKTQPMKKIVLLFSSVLLAVTSHLTMADTLISTLGQPRTQVPNLFDPSYRWASDFITQSSPSLVTGLTMDLINLDQISHTVTCSIFQDNGSLGPGSLIGSFSAFNLLPSTAFAHYTVTSSGLSLAPHTIYWMVLQVNEIR